MSHLLWGCKNCGWIGKNKDLLCAPNPFLTGEKFPTPEEILGCPKCKSVENFVNVCDEPGCRDESSCGFPTTSGYRRTCSKHSRIAPLLDRAKP